MYRNFIYDKEYENGENLHFIVDVTEKTGSLFRRKWVPTQQHITQ